MKHGKSCVPEESLPILYKTLVEPYLRYCNTTWGKCVQKLTSKLQTLQNRAARVVIGIKYKEADHDHLLASLGWMNLCIMILSPTCIKSQMELHQSTHSLCLINVIPFIRMKQDQQETEILLLLK